MLTPGMMSLGVPGTVAVASNMCHKFPKALVGAIKRYKYGQVDIKLGLVMAASAAVGVQIGIKIQEWILAKWGQAGSNLYVSLSFVAVLIIVGGYVFYDAWKTSRAGGEEKTPALALWLQSINLPPMVTFKTANLTISLWFTIPIGLATGLLAATIAVGGFVGVPGMIYVMGVSGLVSSASELVIAFVMGFGGSIKVGHRRHGGHSPDPHHPGRITVGRAIGGHRYHLCQRAHDQDRHGHDYAHCGGQPGFGRPGIPDCPGTHGHGQIHDQHTQNLKLYFHVYRFDRRRGDYSGRHVAGQGRGNEKSQRRIVPRNRMAEYKNILLGVDGSDASLHAFTEGVRLADRDVRLVAVSVAPEYNGDLRLLGVQDARKLITPALRCGLVPLSGSGGSRGCSGEDYLCPGPTICPFGGAGRRRE